MVEKAVGVHLSQPLIAYIIGLVALATIAFNGAAWVINQSSADVAHDSVIIQLKTDMIAADTQIRKEMTDAINLGRIANEKLTTTLEALVDTTQKISIDVVRLQTMQEASRSTLTGLNLTSPDFAASRPSN